MNAQAILDQIREDARAQGEKILADAQAKASETKAASREKIEAMHQSMISQAEKESAEMEQRMLRMAELDERKELLQKKRGLMDEAFALASQKLRAMPKTDKRAFFLGQVEKAAQGNETLRVGAEGADWFDGGFVAEANQSLEKQGKPAGLRVDSAGAVPGATGVVLAAQGMEVHCTFEALLDTMRAELETQVANALFGK